MSERIDQSGRAGAGVLAGLGGIRSPALQEAVVVEQTADVGEVAGGLRPPVAFRVVVRLHSCSP